MLVQTRCFGEIDLDENKIITFDQGMLGFEEYKRYTILYDIEKEKPTILWLQSLDEPGLAFPIINPSFVKKEYNPVVDDSVVETLGACEPEDMAVYLTVAIPLDVKEATFNMKAPILINSITRKACQVIASNPDYEVKAKLYDALQQMKKEGKIDAGTIKKTE